MGGFQVQPNVVSTETLKDAQTHPESHRDLLVRVSGFCALFTNLPKPLQDDIIARTELRT
jgi:pyruvate-formate lyase